MALWFRRGRVASDWSSSRRLAGGKRFTSARRASQAAQVSHSCAFKSFLLGSLKAGRRQWVQPLSVGLTAGKHRHTCVTRALGTQLMETSQESSLVFRVHVILLAGEILFFLVPIILDELICYFKHVEFRHHFLKLNIRVYLKTLQSQENTQQKCVFFHFFGLTNQKFCCLNFFPLCFSFVCA